MKNNIENSFKQSLENFEVPYSPEAWTALNAKLDARQAAPSSRFKWWMAAGIIAIVAVTATYFISNEENKNDAKIIAENTSLKEQTVENQKAITKINPEISDSEIGIGEQTAEINSNTGATVLPADKNAIETGIQSNDNAGDKITPFIDNAPNNTQVEGEAVNETPSVKPSNNKPFTAPELKNICLGSDWSVENTNDANLILLAPNGQTITVGKKSKKTIKPAVSGEYLIGYFKGSEFSAQSSVIVHEAKALDFFIDDDTPIENGIPSIRLYTNAAETKLKWKIENQSRIQTGSEIEVHYFKKGNYKVTLENTDVNGCKAETTKEISVKEEYNLLATNAFKPFDSDERNNTFMPRALLDRNTPFDMIIIDPLNGEVIYETSDVYAGWTGVDKRTGKMVQIDKNYIWKVTIKNPLPGEKQVYNGTVVPIN